MNASLRISSGRDDCSLPRVAVLEAVGSPERVRNVLAHLVVCIIITVPIRN